MHIALDYDYTYKLAPSFWDTIIAEMRAQSHQVFIFSTGRVSDGEQLLSDLNGKVDGVVFTNGAKKKDYMVFQDGRQIDVWMDAAPETIV